MHTEELRGSITSQVPGTNFEGGPHPAEQPHQQEGPGIMESLPCPGCPRHLAETWCLVTEGADQGLEAPRVWEQDVQTSPGFPGSVEEVEAGASSPHPGPRPHQGAWTGPSPPAPVVPRPSRLPSQQTFPAHSWNFL